jgi:1-acyl-sn-glycerol-3-phosphate acyltransferase
VIDSLAYHTGRGVVDLYARLLLDLDVVWKTPLPEGPVVVTPNHPTTVDPFLLPALLRRRLTILITGMAFDVPLFGHYLRLAGHVPVVDGNGRAAFDAARAHLRSGRGVVLFPEGALSPLGGGLGSPKTGAVRLALETGAPLVPVGIALDPARVRFEPTTAGGTTEVARWYRRGPYAVTVGAPVRLAGDPEDRAGVIADAAWLNARIAELAGESHRRRPVAGRPAGSLPTAALRPTRIPLAHEWMPHV